MSDINFSVPTKASAAGVLKEADEDMSDTFKLASSGNESDISRNPEGESKHYSTGLDITQIQTEKDMLYQD